MAQNGFAQIVEGSRFFTSRASWVRGSHKGLFIESRFKGFLLREGLRFLQFRTPKLLFHVAQGPSPEQHAWQYPFRKLQAPPFSQAPGPKFPNCVAGTLFASSRPENPNCALPRTRRAPSQQHAWEYPFRRGGPLPSPAASEYPFRKPCTAGPSLPNCVLPRAAGPSPAAHVGVRFRKLQISNSRIVYAYPFRKLQAPNSRIVCSPARCAPRSTRGSTLFASSRPETPELCTPPRGGPFPAARVGVRLNFRKLQVPNSRIVYSPFRKLQAPNSRIVYVAPRPFPRGSTLLGLGDWNRQEPRTEPQEPSEKPNRMNLNRLFKTATEPNRYIHVKLNRLQHELRNLQNMIVVLITTSYYRF